MSVRPVAVVTGATLAMLNAASLPTASLPREELAALLPAPDPALASRRPGTPARRGHDREFRVAR